MPDRPHPTHNILTKTSGYRYFAIVLGLAVVTLAAMWHFK